MTMAISVDELQRAWTAVESGQFRSVSSRRRDQLRTWSPRKDVIAVVGATGRVGASTVALAMAEAASRSARVVECAPRHASGLAFATTAELGETGATWRGGSRGRVLLERAAREHSRIEDITVPSETDRELTILDVAWDPVGILGTNTWLADALATTPLVVVTVATAPGVRALDQVLQQIGRPASTWCVVVGPSVRRWPKSVRLAATERIDQAVASDRLVTVPSESPFGLSGLTAEPIPRRVLEACAPLTDRMLGHLEGSHHDVV